MRHALAAWRYSPEKRRIQAEGCHGGLTGPTTTTLRGRKGRTGSSRNVWQNQGYLARQWPAQEDRWRQQQGSRGSERNKWAQICPDPRFTHWLAGYSCKRFKTGIIKKALRWRGFHFVRGWAANNP